MCVGVFVAFHEADTSQQKCYQMNFNQMIQNSLKFFFFCQLYLSLGLSFLRDLKQFRLEHIMLVDGAGVCF